MARDTIYVCSECAFQSPQWHGRCPGCEAWGTLVEERLERTAGKSKRRPPAAAGASAVRPLRDVTASAAARLSTGIGELDRVLGGGLVPGSLVLLGGSPGIGKSTLTNMALGHLAGAGHATLYVSGEESAEQVRLRAERLGPNALEVPILAETDLETVLATLASDAPRVCVIDSVQTLRSAELSGAPGSVGQVREVTGRIMELAKERGIAVVLVGHVTKDGALAGPRVLEHLVDCVLQFEGERERPYRELRALKNRFGSTNEAGLFEMRQGGLVEVLDASARFVAGATRAPAASCWPRWRARGRCSWRSRRSSRPPSSSSRGGWSRASIATAWRSCSRSSPATGASRWAARDVFVNVVGGVRVDEPGCDLAVALAVASAARGVPLRGTPRACFGELGLTGELRWVGHPERRLAEAAKHGLHGTIAPAESGAGACEVATLREALTAALASEAKRPARVAA